jgi:hypothetical protein
MTGSLVSGSLSADLPPGAVVLSKGSGGTYPSSDMPFNGFLASGKILTLGLHADLVTLSACDTARGRLEDQQFVGLPSAFLAAGANSVVMSIWSIPDAPTAELMLSFYKELLSGRPKSVALRHAMIAARNIAVPRRHPRMGSIPVRQSNFLTGVFRFLTIAKPLSFVLR